MKKHLIMTLMIVGLIAGNAVAKKTKKLNQAQLAKQQNLHAITIYVDAHSGSRTKGSASNMTKIHQQFFKEGYQLMDVDVYTEDGDLEGFFVSYKKIN